MAKWGYLARAYAIKEYSYLRQTEAENSDEENGRTSAEADEIENVRDDIRIVLEMAEDNCDSARESPYEYQTIRQCKKWLKDFA